MQFPRRRQWALSKASLFYSFILLFLFPSNLTANARFGSTAQTDLQEKADSSVAGDDSASQWVGPDPLLSLQTWQAVPLGDGAEGLALYWDSGTIPFDDEEAPSLIGKLSGWLISQRNTLLLAEYVPQELKEALKTTGVPIFILDSKTKYEAWLLDHPTNDFRREGVSYDGQLKIIVSHPESRGIGESARDLRNYILQLHAREMLRSAAPAWAKKGPQWLLQGLADLVSVSSRGSADKTVVPYLHRQGFQRVVKVLNSSRNKPLYWLPAGTLFAVQGTQQLRRLPLDHKKATKSRKTLWSLWFYFDRQSSLWTHFLLEQDASSDGPLAACLRDAVRGELDADTTLKHLGFASSPAAEKAILDWIGKNAKSRSGLALKLPKGSKSTRSGKARGPLSKGNNPAPANAAPVLTMEPLNAEEVILLAQRQAEQGLFEVASQTLRAAADGLPDAATLTDEAERMEATTKAREALIQMSLREQKKLRYQYEDKMVVVKPTAWDAGTLTLAPSSKCPLTELNQTDLDASFLVANWRYVPASEKSTLLEAHLQFLSDNKKWKRSLGKAAPDLVSLWETRKKSATLGPVLHFMQQAGKAEAPEPNFSALTQHCRTFFAQAEPRRHEAFFRQTAEAHLDALAGAAEVEDLVNARTEALEDGRVRLIYAFEEPEEGLDFEESPNWWIEYRKMLPVKPTKEDQREPTISDSALRLQGNHSLGHRFQWDGPVSVKYRYMLHEDSAEEPIGMFFIALHVIDPFCWARTSFGLLEAHSPTGRSVEMDQSLQAPLFVDVPYEGTLAWDGKNASLVHQDSEPIEVKHRGPKTGSVILWVQSIEPIYMERLVIEGTVAEESLDKARAEWREEQRERLRLKPKE